MHHENDRQSVASVTLESESGFRVVVIDRGAAVAAIQVPTPPGLVDAALRYPALGDYLRDEYFLGSTIGRYANRIANGRLKLNGGSYQLATDPAQGGHCLHGGPEGFHRQAWLLDPAGKDCVTCRYIAEHGEQGFPGRLDVSVTYQLVGDMTLIVDCEASSDRNTVVNIANHTYFNLDPGAESIGDHVLCINADRYTPVDESKIPIGELRPVEGTEFDFRSGVRLDERTNGAGSPRVPTSFDHNFVVAGASGKLREAATLFAPASGIGMRLSTTQPGLQLYTGEGLDTPFAPRSGLCLEAQNFPDSPNQPDFPPATLLAGETYRQRTMLDFSVDRSPEKNLSK